MPARGLGRVAQVGVEEQDIQETLLAAVKMQQDTMVDLMSQLVQRIERLETHELGPVADQGERQKQFYQASTGVTRIPK